MSYCLNPNCQKPQNPTGTKFCQNCGSKLLLKGHYRALKLIGQGGFGRTFLAVHEDKLTLPLCVIKQFFPQTQGIDHTQKAAELFEQEVLRLNKLGNHPQIPQLLDYFIPDPISLLPTTNAQKFSTLNTQHLNNFKTDGQQYLVQEFIDGQNLAQILEVEGSFSEAQIRDLLNSLLPVVAFIHSHNVIHRDIKPENIICRADGQLFLVDFGAAKFATGTGWAKTGTVIGSAGYAAPEQAGGKAVFVSDLYSLGVTCIHLLTQVEPFDLYSFSEATWVWRNYLNTPVSRQLGKVLDKMIETATSRRYQSAADVLIDLNLQLPPVAAAAMRGVSILSTQQKWRCVETLTSHAESVLAVAFSPDGEVFATGDANGMIKIWHLHTGAEVRTLWVHTDAVTCLAFSPDGQILASGSADKTIKLWQLITGQELCTIRGHSDRVYAVAMSSNGEILASGSEDKTIRIWEVKTGWELRTIGGWFAGHSDVVYAVAFSPKAQTLATGSADKIIKIWQVSTGQELRCLTGHSSWVRTVAFSSDGQLLASGSSDKTVKIWQVSTGWALHSLTGHTSWVRTVAFSPDGKILASGSDDKTIKIWQMDTGQELCTLRSHRGTVYAVAFSREGKTLVSGSDDQTIKIWQC